MPPHLLTFNNDNMSVEKILVSHKIGDIWSAGIDVTKGNGIGQILLGTYIYKKDTPVFIHQSCRGDYGKMQEVSGVLDTNLAPEDFLMHPKGVTFEIPEDLWTDPPKNLPVNFNFGQSPQFMPGVRFVPLGYDAPQIRSFELKTTPNVETKTGIRVFIGNRMLPVATFSQLPNGRYDSKIQNQNQILSAKQLVDNLIGIALTNKRLSESVLEGRMSEIERQFELYK